MTPNRSLLLIVFLGPLLASNALAGKERPTKLNCNVMNCREVLPLAERFDPVPGKPHVVGKNKAGETVGWVVMSTDLVDVKAYSGSPLVTLVGLDPKGIIRGARVIHHSEPILLVGIPESKLHDFSKFYVGKPATSRIVVGRAAPGAIAVDVISGATVTALAQNRTILESARMLGVTEGVVKISAASPGHFVQGKKPLTWQQLVDDKVMGHLVVSEKEMGVPDPEGDFVNIWFTIADAPQVGRALMGDYNYKHYRSLLKPGEHLFVIFSNGSNSYKGSGFVRGGLFDRIRIEQGLRELSFRDTDYFNLPDIFAEGAPEFKEGGVFISSGAAIDPGAAYRFIFLGSRYDGRGAFTREFHQFKFDHRLPRSVYIVEGGDLDQAIYVQAWRNHQWGAILLVVFLLWVMGIFIGRRYSTASRKRLQRIHLATMVISVVMMGYTMKAQPSVTQLMTLVHALVGEWRWDLFLSEPLVFMVWIFIAIVSLIWGRGVFCGWICPYGSLTELVRKIGIKLGLKEFELPLSIHRWARYLRYPILVVLIAAFLHDSILGEKLAELEPFKSTFFVYFWQRHWGFGAWWVILLFVSLFWWRPFCRYLCPLGAGLAIYGSFAFAGPLRRKFCGSCRICTRDCEPMAIQPDGRIDRRECLSCMECEASYRDHSICPPLVGIAKLNAKAPLGPEDQAKMAKLEEDRQDI